MTYNTTFSCSVGTTDSSGQIGLEIWLDQQQIFNSDLVTETQKVEYSFPEDEAEHQLQFIVKNKQPDGTVVDEQGQIIRDVCLTIKDIQLDDLDVDQVFFDNAVYRHNYNGTGSAVEDNFFGVLGCNGTVELRFTTPIYLWLLEHM